MSSRDSQEILYIEEYMIISQTPLRVSFVGGGTDLPAYALNRGGAVVSSAIDKFIYVIINRRFDDKIVVGYTRKEIVNDVSEIEHELVREALRKTGITKGVEITTMADIPSEGSGLGSSSSVTVGLLNACYAYQGVQVTAERLAREACEIEIDICGKPIGKQDQYIAAYGGLCFMAFNPDGSVEVTPLNIDGDRHDLSSRFALYFTDITRKADPILKRQQEGAGQVLERMDHLKALALDVRDAIGRRDYDRIGTALKENWELKRSLAEGITTPEIDAMVETAMENGAVGCKISGAGGGGFLFSYCPSGDSGRLTQAMSNYRRMPFFLERYGSRIVFNVEGYEWQ